MKLYGTDKSVLMEITGIKAHPDGLLIEGKIMGAMPMKAILRGDELRRARTLVGWAVVRRALGMVVTGLKSKKPARSS